MMDAIAIFAARWLIWLMAPAAFVIVAWADRRKHPLLHAWELALTGAVAYVGTFLLQIVVVRPRPFVSDDVVALIPEPFGYSFPSGHATIAFTVATYVYLHHRVSGCMLYVAAALVAAGRVLVHVHYVTDVLAGAIVGSVLAWWMYRFVLGAGHKNV